MNLLNELWKKDKMRGLLSILSLFRYKLNTFNACNTGSRMLYFIYHWTLKKSFGVKSQYLPYFTQRFNGPHPVMLLSL